VKYFREIIQADERPADVMFIEIQTGDLVASRRVQSEVALLASVLLVAEHGLEYPRQTFRHLVDLPIIENEDCRIILFCGSEFHEELVVSSGVESDGDVFGPVFVDEKDAFQQDPFQNEWQIDGLDVADVGVKFLRLDEFRRRRRQRFGSVGPTSSSRHCRAQGDRAT